MQNWDFFNLFWWIQTDCLKISNFCYVFIPLVIYIKFISQTHHKQNEGLCFRCHNLIQKPYLHNPKPPSDSECTSIRQLITYFELVRLQVTIHRSPYSPTHRITFFWHFQLLACCDVNNDLYATDFYHHILLPFNNIQTIAQQTQRRFG
jgi:hypothetical protein